MSTGDVQVVTLDIGGPVYDDATYAAAVRQGLRDLGATVTTEEFARVYDTVMQRQSGSLRGELAARFLGSAQRSGELSAAAERHWSHPPHALYADVLPALRELQGRVQVAVVANQQAGVAQALERDGVAAYIDYWAVSGVVGVEKPDPRIFRHVLTAAAVPAHRVLHVGNRLDRDVRPAKALGMRTVLVLRGEAPPSPTAEQLGEPDAAVTGLEELPAVLANIGGVMR